MLNFVVMKKILLLACLTFFSGLNVYAQNRESDSLNIQKVIDACVALRDAVVINDTATIRQVAVDLKTIGVADFNTLSCKDDSTFSLKGHLVFNVLFAENLAKGNAAIYDKADEVNSSVYRGQTADGSYFTKTYFLKTGKSTKWIFDSEGYQELAVVAESGGLVTMKIHVTNDLGFDKHFDDTKFVKVGLPQRKTTFSLPKNIRNKVELEVVNCGKKDCSIVIISN